MYNIRSRFSWASIILFFLFTFSSCSKDDSSVNSDGSSPEKKLAKVVFLTDWYPQPEHGGFYQAKALGFYEQLGLDVEIRSGGGMRDIRPLTALRQVDMAIGTSDTTLIARAAGLPLVALAPFFINDPQCVMSHEELGIETLEDLDGKVVMMQSSLSHAQYLMQIKNVNMQLIPLDFSISRFATDKSFAQQCFLTAEPIQLAQQDIFPKVIPLSESGFDPYRHVYTSKAFLEEHPDLAKKFIEASLKGWLDFVDNDPTPGLKAIIEQNPQQNMETMLLSVAAIKRYSLVHGAEGSGEMAGVYTESRLKRHLKVLKSLGLIGEDVVFEESFAKQLLPKHYQ